MIVKTELTRHVRKSALLASTMLLLALQGCNSFGYYPNDVDGGLLGRCLTLATNFEIYQAKRATVFQSERISFPEGGEPSFAMRESIKNGHIWRAGTLEKGSRVEITKVTTYEPIWVPYYLRIIVRVLDGEHAGREMDLATYARYHPRPSVVTSSTLDPTEIEFIPDYLIDCE